MFKAQALVFLQLLCELFEWMLTIQRGNLDSVDGWLLTWATLETFDLVQCAAQAVEFEGDLAVLGGRGGLERGDNAVDELQGGDKVTD